MPDDVIGILAGDEESDSCAVAFISIIAGDLLLRNAISCAEELHLKAVAVFTCEAIKCFH